MLIEIVVVAEEIKKVMRANADPWTPYKAEVREAMRGLIWDLSDRMIDDNPEFDRDWFFASCNYFK